MISRIVGNNRVKWSQFKDDKDVSQAQREQALGEGRRARRGDGTLGQLLADPDSLDRARELLGDMKRLLDEADDGIRAAVAGQPVNTIHGAVFSVF